MYTGIVLNCFMLLIFFSPPKKWLLAFFSGVQRASRETKGNRDSSQGFHWTWSTIKSGDIVGNTCQEPAGAL